MVKDRILNVFIYNAFKKHVEELLDIHSFENCCKLFFYLPSIVDRKESIRQYMENVNLNPINSGYEKFRDFSSNQNYFYLQHLDLKMIQKEKLQLQLC